MHQPTIEKLHAMRLGAMANALTAQLQQPEIDAMPFAERLALLVDIQHSAMLSTALEQRLRRAGMRQSACLENLDLRTPRGLDRSTMQALASGYGSASTVMFQSAERPGSAKVGLPALWAIRPPATASRCSTSASRGCSTSWRLPGCMAVRHGC
jgi:hypothetical protein